MTDWNYFDRFERVEARYLPNMGEGETRATQIVTAVTKLVYKFYNDGDVFDNTYYLEGWAHDLSSYANWLYENTDAKRILDRIEFACTEDDYTDLLADLADKLLDDEYLENMDKFMKVGSIYKCDGKFKFTENYDDECEYDEEEIW